MKFSISILTIVLFVWSVSCGAIAPVNQVNQSMVVREVKGCICYLIYKPICASDGITYANDCVLRCAQNEHPWPYYLIGLCHGECPCCKEPYIDETFPHWPGNGWGPIWHGQPGSEPIGMPELTMSVPAQTTEEGDDLIAMEKAVHQQDAKEASMGSHSQLSEVSSRETDAFMR